MNDESEHNTSLMTSLENIWKNSLGIIKDIFKLFALEVKLAGKSLAVIVVMVVLVSLLLLSSWFSLLGALLAWLMTFKINLILSLIILSAINLIIAFFLGLYIVRISNNLQFRETRKQLDFNRRDDNETITSQN